MQLPPEDSIFSLPIWKSGFRDPNASHIQMNPQSAYQQNDSKKRTAQVFAGVGMAVLMIAVVLGTYYTKTRTQTTNVQASLNLKKAMHGTIESVDINTNSFVFTMDSSLDEAIISSGVTRWTVSLPPGSSLVLGGKETVKTCYTVPDLEGSLDILDPASCQEVVSPGEAAYVEYIILKPEKATAVAKSIIGQRE